MCAAGSQGFLNMNSGDIKWHLDVEVFFHPLISATGFTGTRKKKVQVGGHAPTHRLNKSLNLLLLILQRSGKSSEVRRQKLVNHCSVWQRQQETNPDCGTQAGKASLHSWFKHLKTKKQDLVEDLTCPGELSMTCTSGILVDMFEKTRRCHKKNRRRRLFF